MSKQQNEQKNTTIQVETDIDERLTIHDIKNDLAKCNRMIKRTEHRIKSYKLKLKFERFNSTPDKTLLQKGLALFNLLPKHHSKV